MATKVNQTEKRAKKPSNSNILPSINRNIRSEVERKPNLKINKTLLLLVLIAMIVAGISLFLNMKDFFSILQIKDMPASIIVSGREYGFDLNSTAIKFGMVPAGGSATRDLMLRNDYGRDVKVDISIKGKIAPFISMSDNNFILKINENKTITFHAYMPQASDFGMYDGKITVVIRKT